MRSRLYRVLLLAFPRDVRRDFGADMEALFLEQRRTVRGSGVARLWIAAIGDALQHGVRCRIENCTSPPRVAPGQHKQPTRWWMDVLRHDLRYALRMLLKQPGTTVTMLLTLALGIGANTAVFSVINAVLLRELPYPDPGQLVMVWEKREAEGVMENVVSPADYLDWARTNQSFSSTAALSLGGADLTGQGDPVQVPLAAVSPSFFDLLQTRPLLGRTFNPEESTPGRHRVVVLTHGFWQRRFGADAAVVGRTIVLNGIPHEVIGVLPASFESPAPPQTAGSTGEPVAIWAPLVLETPGQPTPRASHYLTVFARLKPAVTLEQAKQELDGIGKRLEQTYPTESRGHGAHVVSLREHAARPVRDGLVILQVAVAFVLLIACVNVANLLLARGAGRRRELAIRSAVGAGRARLVRQALTESALLAGISGVVGLAVAAGGLRLLVAQTPVALRGVGLERAGLDATVLAFAFGVCLLAGVAAGLLPAWQLTRADPGDPLRDGGRSPGGVRKSIRFALIAAEVSLTAILLVGAGLMLRSLDRVLSQPAGFETANRVTATVVLPRGRYSNPDAIRRARHELEARLRAIGGVLAVGANNNLPLTASDSRRGVQVDGYERTENEPPTRAHTRIVTPEYFRAVGIQLKEGRGFTEQDVPASAPVVVINETMARRYWKGASPVGSRVRFAGNEPWREVVGVIRDVRHWGLDLDVNPELYMPHEQQPSSTLSFVLHATRDASAIVPEIRRQVLAFDRDLPIALARSMEDVAARSVAARRWSAVLLGSFAVLALTLAAVGIYGVMSQLVLSRTPEIGIRLTLGARRSALLANVCAKGSRIRLPALPVASRWRSR